MKQLVVQVVEKIVRVAILHCVVLSAPAVLHSLAVHALAPEPKQISDC
jgi:hypothetical protein